MERALKKSPREKADLLVEQVKHLVNANKLMHEKLGKTNEWHAQLNGIAIRL